MSKKVVKWQEKVDDLSAVMIEAKTIEQERLAADKVYDDLTLEKLAPLVKCIFAISTRVKGQCQSNLKGKPAIVAFLKGADQNWFSTLNARTAEQVIGPKPECRIDKLKALHLPALPAPPPADVSPPARQQLAITHEAAANATPAPMEGEPARVMDEWPEAPPRARSLRLARAP